ncbi:D-inositol 3-phosphate glycosyltransferase [Frondihabitans sp. 762G35]|uniref:glycosyltransferase family 4 protein n=1 Tax=Frondihabitans sp. 762G35 TaxID=1446794 RepID=UPI000D22CD17|nr:glycosyltransferase family 1 protein [Frondihabitans sp. 762G35]ARC57431.1 D-inositol 3-phosphate glycosyltransferase [Frondihabitans sp. 762G35]
MPVVTLATLAHEGDDRALRAAAAALSGSELGWRRSSGRRLVREIARAFGDTPDDSVSYLLLACLGRGIPAALDIVEFTREWRRFGLERPLTRAYETVTVDRVAQRSVEVVVQSGLIADVTDTGRSRFTTGIQRVARETLTRWARDHDVTLVSWDRSGARLGGTPEDEIDRVVLEDAPRARIVRVGGATVIPFEATYVLPEISVAGRRTENIHTIARFGRGRSIAIGFDCIPVTTSETTGPGMPGAFSKYLAALASFQAVGAISAASAGEYAGWRRMLAGAGLEGPRVETVALPWQSEEVSEATVDRVRSELGLDDGRPTVLAVGSHEPRKNHLNLVTAAELRWRAGDDFHLVMVGGNSWNDREFQELVRDLRRRGRPISLLSGVDDETVWALYGVARFSVFCSINEGFGLPVAESLASGTPVVTADFGSQRELGEGNGALCVSPHDVRAIAEALGSLLGDDTLIEELSALSRGLERPSWDDYADAMWELTRG